MRGRLLFLLIADLLLVLLITNGIQASPQQQPDNNEFAEFEVSDGQEVGYAFGEEDNGGVGGESATTQHTPPPPPNSKTQPDAEDFFVGDAEGNVEDEDDDEEFEGYDEERQPGGEAGNGKAGPGGDGADEKKPGEIKPLTFADVPSHFRSNWSSYQVEAIALVAIFLYIVNYLYGKTHNSNIAYNWFTSNQQKLEKHFSLVGDNGTSQEATGGHLMKDTDFSFSCWCSGRAGCRGMLSQLKLNKRQDLLGLLLNLFWPKQDRVTHTIELDQGEMDSFVLVVGKRKSVLKEVKELNDLGTYAPERKLVDKMGLPSTFSIFAEINESLSAIFDTATIQFINQHEKSFEYIHVSDQFSGARPTEDTASKLPETRPVLIFSYFLIDGGGDSESEEMVLFMFHLLERIRRYRLSKEGKSKADKKRQEVEEQYIRATHQQRQEAAMARREEKTRERKQRLMEEQDPDRQRRLEKLEQKRDAKLRQPKMKQFKMK